MNIDFTTTRHIIIPEGVVYKITDSQGNIVWTFPNTVDLTNILIDFEYNQHNNVYTLTKWNNTQNGVASTELVIPDCENIIL